MDVFGIFIAVSFIGLIVTLVVTNIVKRIKKSQEYKPYSEYYVAEKSKDLGLAAKVLSDQHKTKVLTSTYEAWKNHDSQELFDTGKVSPIVGLKFNTAPPNKSATCASNETPPDHKTRVKLRKKRKSKQQ